MMLTYLLIAIFAAYGVYLGITLAGDILMRIWRWLKRLVTEPDVIDTLGLTNFGNRYPCVGTYLGEQSPMDKRTLARKVSDLLVDEAPTGLTNEQIAHRLDQHMPSIRRTTLGLYNAGILFRHEYTTGFEYHATTPLIGETRARRLQEAAAASGGHGVSL